MCAVQLSQISERYENHPIFIDRPVSNTSWGIRHSSDVPHFCATLVVNCRRSTYNRTEDIWYISILSACSINQKPSCVKFSFVSKGRRQSWAIAKVSCLRKSTECLVYEKKGWFTVHLLPCWLTALGWLGTYSRVLHWYGFVYVFCSYVCRKLGGSPTCTCPVCCWGSVCAV